MNRRTIVQDVKVAFVKIDNLLAFGIFDPRVSNIPFFRYRPIEDLSIRGDFFAGHRRITAEIAQALSKSLPSDTTADRVKVRNDAKELSAFLCRIPIAQHLAN